MDKTLSSIIIISLISLTASADTFVHRSTHEKLYGYATSKTENGKTVVQTKENGRVSLNLAQYIILEDPQGRNNSVAIISIPEQIKLEMETDAFSEALTAESDKGPLFILIEIDSPGGRVDLTMRMCGAIAQLKTCQTVAFVNGGKYGGAYSAGAAIALACDKIYMESKDIEVIEVLTRRRCRKMRYSR
ncbi:MAG: ATP-dependent Clp protease proteolytic subunit [Planctomycetes bacterium]|nr:ATP-dependent Clp protease proteolytic subunit [Planctomycetota bacterium]